ncbi:response regulator [Siphonobacter sp. SORGH_AS_0500]|uniref:response regulator n=1 Tax=Siphonobacter sp. SORGH_AS_0500 TaxID=1864824 RepID=UPI0028567DFF|nr:response regulator [Siphonobacter sp. SORGH_AS_0500]MDR6197406.1 DNA-binding response OmpR family regulator [Siphonobacter sp. SORGH_AS_0500]
MIQIPIFVVVDNNTDYQRILKMAFQKSQIDGQLHFSEDASQLFDLLEKLDSKPDLFILDYELSSSNGIEIAKRIMQLEKWKTIPIIIFSFLDSAKVKKQALELGIKAFVAKPESYNGTIEFWNAIRTYL